MIRTILAALQLWVAPILAGFFTLWSGLVAFAEHDDAGVSRLLSPSEPVGRGQLAPARSLHVVHLRAHPRARSGAIGEHEIRDPDVAEKRIALEVGARLIRERERRYP